MIATAVALLAWSPSTAPPLLRAPRSPSPQLTAAVDADVAALIQLCALTDRGQRCTERDKTRIGQYLSALEAAAPPTDASLLNGRWRLLYASQAVYRSSPFFWAFRQASASQSTPVSVPSGGVQAGDSLASAIFAITDAIPFYDLGPVHQTITGVCSEWGCGADDPSQGADAPTDGAATQDEPSDGGAAAVARPSLVSRVELSIDRLFGFPAAKCRRPAAARLPRRRPPPAPCPRHVARRSIMTTTAYVSELPASSQPSYGGAFDVSLSIATTSAAESTIAQTIPGLESLLTDFGSGDALESVAKGSSTVRMRSTYLDNSLRIARPVLSLGDGAADEGGVFVFVRDED